MLHFFLALDQQWGNLITGKTKALEIFKMTQPNVREKEIQSPCIFNEVQENKAITR